MEKSNYKTEFTDRQTICLWAIGPLFMLYVLHFIPDCSLTIKILLFILGGIFISWVADLFANNISFLYTLDAWKSVIRTMLVILLMPIIILIVFYVTSLGLIYLFFF